MKFPIMPWCRIDRAYSVGDVTIIPYRGRLDSLEDVLQQHLARVLGTYWAIEGRPVEHAAVVRVCLEPEPGASKLYGPGRANHRGLSREADFLGAAKFRRQS
jgi:hypothetical protein